MDCRRKVFCFKKDFFCIIFVSFLTFLTSCLFLNKAIAEESSVTSTSISLFKSSLGSGETGAFGDNCIFTGAFTHSIPIEVPPGRCGLSPNISLNYNSQDKGNGWIGVGWSLDMGSITRNIKNGIDYTGNDFVYSKNGSSVALIRVDGTAEYRARLENGDFIRFYQYVAPSGIQWIAYDKSGKVYYFGQTPSSRQDNPDNTSQCFQWKLDRVEDSNRNYMTLTYSKDQGQIYLDRIDYTGNENIVPNASPSNYVKFYLDDRTDSPTMYTINFPVKTAKRLMTIEVRTNGDKVRVYKLEYDDDILTEGEQYSASTSRSLLSSVKQFGNDYKINLDGRYNQKLCMARILNFR